MSVSLLSESARVRLAHLSLEAARKVPGVVGTDAGPGGLCTTGDPPHGVLHGVSVIAQADGRYEISLCLTAKLVPLPALGEAVTSAVRGRIEREGLASVLGEIYVEFAQVLTDAEIVAERMRAAETAAEQPLAAQAAVAGARPHEAQALPDAEIVVERMRAAEAAAEQALAAQAAVAEARPGDAVVVVAARVPSAPAPAFPTKPPLRQEPSSVSEPHQRAGTSPETTPPPLPGEPPTPPASSPSSSASAATTTEPPMAPREAPSGKASSPDSVPDQEREQ